MKKRFFSLLLVLTMVLSLLPASAFAAEIVDSGECGAEGSNVTWTLDSDGLLTISGSGKMADYESSDSHRSPWYEHRNSVQSVIIRSGVTAIGDGAFYRCYSLMSITIPSSVTSIGNNLFSDCSNLNCIEVDPNNSNYRSADGVLFDYQMRELIRYPIGKQETFYAIPNSVTSIGEQAFSHCKNLTGITIPNSVSSIGEDAFSHCTNLTSITIPDGVGNIGFGTFSSCKSLTSITIPQSVTSIEEWAFSHCESLTSITIPISVKTIGHGAFSNCYSLTDVFYAGSEVRWSCIRTDVWNDPLLNATIHFNSTGPADPGETDPDDPENPENPDEPLTPADIKGKPMNAFTDISFRYSVSETTTPGRWKLPYSDSMLVGSAKKYRHDLAKISLGVAMASTNIKVDETNVGDAYIQEMLKSMGFVHRKASSDYGNTQIQTDTCQYIFAVKQLPDTEDYLVCAVIRSNGYGAEWVSNAHVANGSDVKHSAGFKGAADGVYTALSEYLDKLPTDRSHIRLWVTGFSRGGAIANLLGARLTEESGISAEKIFVYGFAVPRTVQKSAAEPYGNIFNIVNQCDLVPRVPLKAWGYERYGVDLYLPCVSKDSLRYRSVRSNMEDYFDVMMAASGLNRTKYSLVSGQERTLDLLLAYLCDIFPTVQSYRDDGYQDAVMNACRMWQVEDADIPPERLIKDVFGVPEYCGKAILQLFENWKKLTPPERTAAIISAEASLNQWASQNGSVQAQKVRNMVLDLLGHVSLYVTLDLLPTAASAFSTSKSRQYLELGNLIADQMSRAKEGRAFASALLMQHWPETYLSWMMTGDENQVYSRSSYKVLSVKCPVDVTVYDESGSVVARIVNDTVDESVDGLYCEADLSGEKMILIPDDAAYRTEITAREAGAVDIVEQEYSAEDELLDAACYIQLPMEEKQVFTVVVDDDCTVTTNGEAAEPSDVLQESNATITIQASAETGGAVAGAKEYALGDTAELIAMPDEHYSFAGWYEGGRLLSTEAVLRFSAVTDRNLTAKFEKEAVTPPTPPAPSNPFTDVKAGAYYYDPVLWAVNHVPQITNGTSATTFSPDATCTRGQVVTFLWRAMGCPEPKSATNPFKDVKEGDYYYKAVLWAAEKNVTNGTSATTFSPNNPCTRAHVVTFLWRAHENPAAGKTNPFTDVAAGQYYTDAVLWAVSKNITNGTSATTFSPGSPCTRGQIVTFLYRDMK